LSLNDPLIVAQPVGSATAAAGPAASVAPLPNDDRKAFTFVVSTRAAGGSRRAQPAARQAPAMSNINRVPGKRCIMFPSGLERNFDLAQ
jgi:hypothetical protein